MVGGSLPVTARPRKPSQFSSCTYSRPSGGNGTRTGAIGANAGSTSLCDANSPRRLTRPRHQGWNTSISLQRTIAPRAFRLACSNATTSHSPDRRIARNNSTPSRCATDTQTDTPTGGRWWTFATASASNLCVGEQFSSRWTPLDDDLRSLNLRVEGSIPSRLTTLTLFG